MADRKVLTAYEWKENPMDLLHEKKQAVNAMRDSLRKSRISLSIHLICMLLTSSESMTK